MDQTVLIVDDDPNIRNLIATLFNRLGFTTLQAEDNQSALEIAKKKYLTLITTDIVHPYQSGIDLIKIIRSSPELRHIPVVVISGNSSKEIELEAWRNGATGYLEKPFGAKDIIDLAEKVSGKISPRDIGLLTIGIESRDLDYKEQIDFKSNTARAEMARDAIGMANAGGGRLIVGVAERDNTFVLKGVPASELSRYETTKINDYIRKYTSSTVSISSRVVRHNELNYVFIEVDPILDTLALAVISNEKAGLYTGRIYIRTQDGRTSELSDPLELRRLIDKLVECRLKHFK